MTTAAKKRARPALPWPGWKVRWRNPEQARTCGWQDVFGPGPFTVVGIVDHSDQGLARGLVLHTELGEREICEVWLALADEPEDGASRRGRVVR
jgi:hypothetical protein